MAIATGQKYKTGIVHRSGVFGVDVRYSRDGRNRGYQLTHIPSGRALPGIWCRATLREIMALVPELLKVNLAPWRWDSPEAFRKFEGDTSLIWRMKRLYHEAGIPVDVSRQAPYVRDRENREKGENNPGSVAAA